MRLFVSIDFHESVKETLHCWLPPINGWKKSHIQQLHLTLVFLGDCSDGEKEDIHRKLSKIEFSPFEMTIEGLGAFPNKLSPRIIWAGIRENDQLMELQQRISDQLSNHIKSKHSGSYIPHITLARKKLQGKEKPLVLKNLQEKEEELTIQVESFQLKQSVLKPQGSEHKILHTYS